MRLLILWLLVMPLLAHEECGLKPKLRYRELLMGEVTSGPHEWPWLAAIYSTYENGTSFICGGTLVSSNIVVAAAHCVRYRERKVSKLFVYLGRYSLMEWGAKDTSVAKQVKRIEVPSLHYKSHFKKADIAVIVLKHAATFSDNVQPACLPQNSTRYEMLTGIVTGWDHREKHYVSPEPLQIEIAMQTNSTCIEDNPDSEYLLPQENFCPESELGVSTCQGEGGEFFYTQQKSRDDIQRWTLQGILSKGVNLSEYDDCCNTTDFLFTDTSKYVTWISEIILEENSVLQAREEVEITLAKNASEVTTEVPLTTPLFYNKFCSLLVSRDLEMSQVTEKQQKKIDILLIQKNFFQQQQKSLNTLLESENNGLVEALKLFKSATEGNTKDEALRFARQIPLPKAAGAFKYISELEINHGNQVLGYLEHHISLPVVKYLISTGADVLAQGEPSWSTPSIIHHAAYQGELHVVQFLVLELGVDINLRDGMYETPLQYASKNRKLNVMQFLLSQDCYVNVRSILGYTALHTAASYGNLDVVKLLIKYNGDENNTNMNGDTPLHHAAYMGHLSIVKYLVTETAADIKATNNKGETPLEKARKTLQSDSAVIQWLTNYTK